MLMSSSSLNQGQEHSVTYSAKQTHKLTDSAASYWKRLLQKDGVSINVKAAFSHEKKIPWNSIFFFFFVKDVF